MSESRGCILVVDDEDDTLRMFEIILSGKGYEVLTTTSGREGEGLLARRAQEGHPVDLVLLDLMMPDLSGTDVLADIRADEATRDLPVIMVSARTEVAQRVKLLKMGANDYLPKPFAPDELLARAAVHIELGRLAQAKEQVEARIAQQEQQLSAIRAIAQQATRQRDLDSMLQEVVEAVADHLSCPYFATYLYEEEQVTLATWAGTASAPPPLPAHPLAEKAVTMRRPVYEQQTLAIPIYLETIPLGALVWAYEEAEKSADSYERALEILANQMAIAINDIYLLEDLQRQNRQLEKMAREQRALVEELKLAQQQVIQNEKLAAAGRLAASLAHEINNPLQAIHSSLQLAVEFDLSPEKQREFLGMAHEEVERLAEIVTRILEFSRPSPGKRQLASVNTLVRQVTNLAHKYLAHSNVALQQVLGSDVPQVEVIPDKIAQVFLHLLLNAIDASDGQGKITIETRPGPGMVQVRFTDQGCGMTPEVQAHIFEPFFSTKEGGSGLGLTVGYGIIDRHGGYIEVNSEPGQGSTFTVYLPRRQ